MLWLAVRIKGVDLQPAEIERKAGGPDDRADPGLDHVQFSQGVGHAVRVGRKMARFGFGRQVQPVAFDIGIGLIQNREVIGIPLGNAIRQAGVEPHHIAGKGLGAAHQRHALAREPPEINRLAAIGAADGDGDMLGARRGGLNIPQAKHPEPPDKITPAVAARRAVMRADREIHAPACALQFIGDLHT